jgi:hypothetical protein
MRIQIPLVIEMTDEQVADYAREYGLSLPVRAKDIVDDVRSYVLTAVQDSPAFGEIGNGTRAAEVSIKR